MEATRTSKKRPSFKTVWAALQENAKLQRETEQLMKERDERFDREMKERDEQFNQQMKERDERQRETDRQMKETDKQLGKLGNRFGEMVEYMVVPNLLQKFHALGFVFDKAYQQATIKDKTNNIFTEVDITLENGDKIMLVEVKSKPTTEDVTEHVERIEKVRFHANLHGEKRKYLGAMAGMVFNDNVKAFTLRNGLYVIEPSGETFTITVPEGIYSPREW